MLYAGEISIYNRWMLYLGALTKYYRRLLYSGVLNVGNYQFWLLMIDGCLIQVTTYTGFIVSPKVLYMSPLKISSPFFVTYLIYYVYALHTRTLNSKKATSRTQCLISTPSTVLVKIFFSVFQPLNIVSILELC